MAQPGKKIGIFVIAYNAVNKLDWTLDRIPEEIWDKVEEVFLFDDCSTDNTYYAAVGYKHAKDVDKLTVHRNRKNLRYGGNQKAGYEYAIARGLDIVVMLHADGQYAPEALPGLLKPLENGEADVVFGSRMAEGGRPLKGGMPLYKFVGNRILTWLENRITGMNLSEFHSGYRLYSCEALKRVPFQLNTDEWHFDTEILLQCKQAGLRIAESPIPTYYGDEICYVNGMAYALNCVKTALRYRLHQARLIHEPKYELDGDQYVYKRADPYSSHAQILGWIKDQRPEAVLEVGTATGYLTSEMAKLGCRVTGIEQDPQMAEIARKHCGDLFVGDLEQMDLSRLGNYDAIVFGDVLEHLRSPLDALKKMMSFLKPGGQILISLPNVANMWVRLNLLMGRFEYQRVGILDESHLRFFTLKSAKQMVDDAGLDVITTGVTPVPLPIMFPATSKGRPFGFLHSINRHLATLMKTLLGYQFIFVCRPRLR
jgi:glycosyltransferase involved in cell wall biosynthesis